MQPGDRFWVGSVTKTFIATVVLQLVGEGRLRLDDKVARWFPDLVPHAREISIRQLLNHTSGVIDYFGDPAFLARVSKNPRLVIPPRRRIAIAASHPLLFRPGTDWRYSNTGYLILGLIVEKVTGNPVGEELENRLVGPLRLEHTTFDSGRRTGAGQVRGYDLSGPTPRDATLDNLGGPWTDGAIVSNTDDIARFFGALLGGQLLPNELLSAMKTTVVLIRGGGGYGLGLGKHKVFCGGAWGHTGGTPGYLTPVLASPSGARIAIVAANGGPTALDATSEHLYCWKHP